MHATAGGTSDYGPSSRLARGPVLLAIRGHESDSVIEAAHEVATRWNAGLLVITVIEPPGVVTGPDGLPLLALLPADSAPARESELRGRLEAVVQRNWMVDVRFGDPAATIADAADEIGASVVIVDAHPRRRLRHAVSGRFARRVLRRLHVPVLALAPGREWPPQRALAAIDFSPPSLAAARTAVGMLGEGAALTLLHVAPAADDGTNGRLSMEALEVVRDELLALGPPGLTIWPRLADGMVLSETLAVADEIDAELIAVGTHGPGFVERFFVGSVAGNVLELASAAVLVSPLPTAPRDGAAAVPRTIIEEPSAWGAVLDECSLRNANRGVTIEVDDPVIGAQVQARGYLLQGIARDPTDDSIEIMLGATSGHAHLTRRVDHVTGLGIGVSAHGHDTLIEIRHGEGRTTVRFDDVQASALPADVSKK